MKKPSIWFRIKRTLLALVLAYVGVLILLLWLENWFLFHPSSVAEEWVSPPAELRVEDVELEGTDGARLHAWWTKPRDWQSGQGAVLYFHGNAGNLSSRGTAMLEWRDRLGLAVLIVDYPGFGRSEGLPNESSCYAAGEGAYAWLTDTAKVPGHRIVLLGGSLGGAMATELAVHHPARMLVLVCAFTSFPDMAQKTFPWLPARWLVRNQLDNLSKIGKVVCPVFIAHGTADQLVPMSQGRRLYAAAHQPKFFFPMPTIQHDEFPTHDCFAALRDFMTANDTAFARTD